MLQPRRYIHYIAVITIVIAAIVTACIMHITRQHERDRAYDNSTPVAHITSPRTATLHIIHNLSQCSLYTSPHPHSATLPPKDIWKLRSNDGEQPIYIALYPDTTAATWCAIRHDEAQHIIRYITQQLCDGYAPVEEPCGEGKMLHFATRDNRFLHIYTAPGVMGCSYHAPLLAPTTPDSHLLNTIHNLPPTSTNGTITHHNGYKYKKD